jgi:hypothetical protein
MKHLQIHRRWNVRGVGAEKPGRPFEQLRFPGRDLVRMHVESLRQLGQRLLALQGGKATFALKAGVWFRRGRLVMISPDVRRYSPLSGGKSTYRSVKIPRASSHEIGFDDLRNNYASPKTLSVVTFAGDEAVRSRIGQGRQEHRRRPFSM